MFPYPSGSGLHVGHPLGYTASDVMSRYYRNTGHAVLHPMGFDSFGLPAEQYAIETGTHPAETTKKNIETFKRQLKSLGFSYDWEREVATTDVGYVKWTQWIFLQLYKKNLAVQSTVPVNWCPFLGTVLSNEETINGLSERGSHPVIRQPLRQWVLKITDYAEELGEGLNGQDTLDWPRGTRVSQKEWIGRSVGTTIDFPIADSNNNNDIISVFTTRPDTIFGVTYLTLAPENPLVSLVTSPSQKAEVDSYVLQTRSRSDLDRASKQTGSGVNTGGFAVHPLTGEKVQVWIGDYVLGGYGTGAVMAVPGHDTRDFSFATKNGLDIEVVVEGAGAGEDQGEDPCFTGKDGQLASNSKNPKEFWGLSTSEAGRKITQQLSDQQQGGPKVTYKLRDWVFSRQRYWGEPIPIYFPVVFEGGDGDGEDASNDPRGESGSKHFIDYDSPIPVDENELPLTLPEMENFEPGDDPAGCLARANEWRYFKRDGKWFARETNTMPQWAGSCWYYLRFTDSKNDAKAWGSEAEKAWMPVDLYIGGAEHAVLHLLYARFWHRVLFDLGLVSTKEPFKKLVHQGMILGADGEKMSKSRGNVVNPDVVVKESGADALRLYEMFMGPFNAVKPWQTEQVAGVVRFRNKVFELCVNTGPNNNVKESEETQKILHKTMKKVTEDIELMQFNTAISALMVLTNHLTGLKGGCSSDTASKLALLVSPFAPHLGEECWSILGNKESLAYESWVEWDELLCIDKKVKIGVQVNGKKRGEVEVLKDASEEEVMKLVDLDEGVMKFVEGKNMKKVIYVPGRILNMIV